MKMCHHVVCGVYSIPTGLGKHERAVTHARIRIADIMGGAMDMSFGKKEFAARGTSAQAKWSWGNANSYTFWQEI